MRAALDRLYGVCTFGAAAALLALLSTVLYSIAGAMFGFAARGAEDVAGYLLAASCALAFGPAFARGEHIRVTLVMDRLRGSARRIAEG